MANVSDFVLVGSFVWSYLFFFIAIFLVIVWGQYLLRKREPARKAKNQRRLNYLKELTEMELRVGFRRQ